MIKKKAVVFLFLWCFVSTFSFSSWATTPTPPQVSVNFELLDSTGVVQLENREKFAVGLNFSPGDLGTIEFDRFSVQLAGGEKTEVKLEKIGVREGRQVLHLQSMAMVVVGESREPQQVTGPSLYQPYYISGGEAKKLSYDEAFLGRREKVEGKSEISKIDLGGAMEASEVSRSAFRSTSIPSGYVIEPASLRDPLDYSKMERRQLPKDIDVADEKGFDDFKTNLNSSPGSSPGNLNDVLAANVIKGHMSLKVAPGSYKAAWGWVVRAWQQVGGLWIFLGWTYVGGDGSWSIGLPAVIPWLPVRIEYRTKNRFVSLQDANGNPYTWGDNWSLTGSSTDIGYRYADLTKNGDLPGVDKLYVGATNIWVKFFNNGMNALRDTPIEVTFPNTMASGKCIYDDGAGPYAWSCSYSKDGKIFIIPAHASETVVQHEIGHSIHSYYWDGDMPPGGGLTHNLWDCYNPGLALTEGFANFLVYWTQFDRNKANPSAPYLNMNIETIPSGVCSNQNAEMRVASTFWDMYDTLNDGPNTATTYDGLHYINQAVPVSLFLNNKRNSMAEYLPVVKAGQSVFWQDQFTKLFRLGKIIP